MRTQYRQSDKFILTQNLLLRSFCTCVSCAEHDSISILSFSYLILQKYANIITRLFCNINVILKNEDFNPRSIILEIIGLRYVGNNHQLYHCDGF